MKKVLRTAGSVALAGLLLGAFALLYSTVRGSSTWYFRVNGHVLVDGRETSGYIHANVDRTILLITTTDGTRSETYLVPITDRAQIQDCGEWTPIRFIPNPIRGANPPCSVSPGSVNNLDSPV